MIDEKIELDIKIIDTKQKGSLKCSKISVNGIQANLFPVKLKNNEPINIFIHPKEGRKLDGEVFICKLNEDNSCTILYKVNICLEYLVFNSHDKFELIKEILEDKEKEIGIVFLCILKKHIQVYQEFMMLKDYK